MRQRSIGQISKMLGSQVCRHREPRAIIGIRIDEFDAVRARLE